MLEPADRSLLLDALQPPDGSHLEWAVATTYSLDLTALLAAPVAFAFAEWQDRQGRPVSDPLMLLKAARQYAERICVFCQAGQIHVPRTRSPLLQCIEDSVVQALAPRGGSFHPKLWFLRYRDADGIWYRVLVQSRNLTFDRSWDTLLRLEGRLLERTNAIARNHPLGDFVAALPGMAIELSPVWRERLETLSYELRRVAFEPPAPFNEIAFWPLGIGDKPARPFGDTFVRTGRGGTSRGLVISPFVDDGFLTDWLNPSSGVAVELVSRLESLTPLSLASVSGLSKLWVLDDLASPEPAEVEEQAAEDDGRDGAAGTGGSGGTNEELPLIGLHAKLFMADAGNQSRVWTGSANATRAAFDRNVEFLVELRGPKKSCGIRALLGDGEPMTGRMPTTIGQMLREFIPREEPGPVDDARRSFDREADRYARAMAAACPVARCIGTDADVFVLEIASPQPVGDPPPNESLLHVWPVTWLPAAAQDCSPHLSRWARFESVSLAGVTAFFNFALTSADERFVRWFALRIPLVDAPANRREHLLQSLLSDPQRVMRYLMLLLLDQGDRGAGVWQPGGQGQDTADVLSDLLDTTLLESMLRTLARAPERLDELARVLDDLRSTPEGAALVPPRLEEIWQPVWEVRQRQLATTTNK